MARNRRGEKLLLVFCFGIWCFCSGVVRAQDDSDRTLGSDEATGDRTHQLAWWSAYMIQLRFKQRWSFWFDSHYNHQRFFVLRPGVSYHFPPGPSVTAGYAYLRLKPGRKARLDRQEHRPWAQVVLPFSFGEVWRFTQRIRADLRIREAVENGEITSGWTVVLRSRLQTVMTYLLPKSLWGQFFLQAAEEVLLNAGEVASDSHFDQNRLSFLLGFKVWSATLRVGYMNRFIPMRRSVPRTHEHTLLFWLNYNGSLLEEESPIPPEGTNP